MWLEGVVVFGGGGCSSEQQVPLRLVAPAVDGQEEEVVVFAVHGVGCMGEGPDLHSDVLEVGGIVVVDELAWVGQQGERRAGDGAWHVIVAAAGEEAVDARGVKEFDGAEASGDVAGGPERMGFEPLFG